MFRAFNLAKFSWNKFDAGESMFEANKRLVRKALDDFTKSKVVDGTRLAEHWFPEIQANVFIAHSRNDVEDAKNLAGFLKQKFNLTSFIDSCVWGYSNDLLKLIDDTYCLNSDSKTYNYEKRNGSTAHVHMMLSTALAMMLDKIIFMNTPNTISSHDAVDKTQSQWIYYELAMVSVIRKRPHGRVPIVEGFANKRAAADLKIEYNVSLTSLTPIDNNHLDSWATAWGEDQSSQYENPLDLLYERIAPDG